MIIYIYTYIYVYIYILSFIVIYTYIYILSFIVLSCAISAMMFFWTDHSIPFPDSTARSCTPHGAERSSLWASWSYGSCWRPWTLAVTIRISLKLGWVALGNICVMIAMPSHALIPSRDMTRMNNNDIMRLVDWYCRPAYPYWISSN